MNIYLISQKVNTDYDSFDSAVVYAKDEESARKIHPNEEHSAVIAGSPPWWDLTEEDDGYYLDSWCVRLKDVEVEYIGKNDDITKEGVICASYNAG